MIKMEGWRGRIQKRILKVRNVTLLIVFLAIFFFTGWKIFRQKQQTNNCKAVYEEMSEFVHNNSVEEDEGEQNSNGQGSVNVGYDFDRIHFAELQQENQELIGWIQIEGTSIDYPVMQADNLFYLEHGFDKSKNKYGVPFLDERSSLTESNLLIYGHRMRDGTMFAELVKYENSTFCQEHRTITWYTEETQEQYQVIGVCEADVDDNNEFFQRMLDGTENLSESWLENHCTCYYYFDEAEYDQTEQMLVLITCEYSTDNGRLVVIAKKD